MIRKLLLLPVLALLVAAGAGCPPGRFASCKDESECGTVDGGKLICYNYRCVECHYDGDCPSGTLCNGNNVCQALHNPQKEDEPAAAPPATTLEECAKRCKGDSSCGDSCREQFKSK